VAFSALAKLRANAGIEDPAVWRIVSGPLDFLWEYARRETAEHLQTEWEKGVLASVAGVPRSQLAGLLLGPDGAAIGFVKEHAGPFVDWRPGRGYHAKPAFGDTLPFSGGFFGFLNTSAKVTAVSRMDNLRVTVTALGADANPGASRLPNTTRLELQCGEESQVLAVRRQRLVEKAFSTAEKAFHWTPACGETTLQIEVGGTRLTRSYSGSNAFLAFMSEFKGGSKVFAPQEFPDQAAALSQMGITALTVKYRLRGMPTEIPAAAAPGPVPTRIVHGWAR
jgi:type VI secretion system protein ImpL